MLLQLETSRCDVGTAAVDGAQRADLALASARSGARKAVGPAFTQGAWLPNGGRWVEPRAGHL